MPLLHDLKILPEYFEDILANRKRSEIRRCDDRKFHVGDELRLWEWNPKKQAYTGRAVLATIMNLQLVNEVLKLYKDKPSEIPMVVLSFSQRLVVTPGTLPPPPGIKKKK